MLRTAYFIRTIENIIKQTPWELKTASENEDNKSEKIEIITVRLTLKS
jgi:hypothetical protein